MGNKYEMIEERADDNGVLRKYGYRADGTVVLVNARQVLSEYKARGLGGWREVA